MGNNNYENRSKEETPKFYVESPLRKREKPQDCKSENTSTIIVGLQKISSNKLEGMPNMSPTHDGIQIYSHPILVEFLHLFW